MSSQWKQPATHPFSFFTEKSFCASCSSTEALREPVSKSLTWTATPSPASHSHITKLPPAAALTATGELAARVIVPWKCQETLLTFDRNVLWESKPAPSVSGHQWNLLTNLCGFPEELQSGKILILLRNNEAFPFHYLCLELHSSRSSLLPGFTSHPHLQQWQTCQLPWGQLLGVYWYGEAC